MPTLLTTVLALLSTTVSPLRLAIHPGAGSHRVAARVAQAAETRGWKTVTLDAAGSAQPARADVMLVVDDDRCALPATALNKACPPDTPLVIARVICLAHVRNRAYAFAYRWRVAQYTRGFRQIHMLLPVLETRASPEYVEKLLDFVETTATK